MARGLGDRSLELLEAFVAAWARGETPDPRETLDAAPADEREALAAALDRALAATPARMPNALNRAYVVELRERLDPDDSPLLTARVARGYRRAHVVRALAEGLGLSAQQDRVAVRYHDLEAGLLDAARVDESVWTALAAILGKGAVLLARPWRAPPAAAPAYYREADAELVRSLDVSARPAAHGTPPDEVDRLFGVG